jgi:putative ATP-dependent endonuclease of OLD family
MNIKKVVIKNFKCFRQFDLTLNDGINLLVGNNEAGKSTLLEAVHLALTGILNGKYLKNELSQHIFNNDVVKEYVESFYPGRTPNDPPYVLIELFLYGEDLDAWPNWVMGNHDQPRITSRIGLQQARVFYSNHCMIRSPMASTSF